MRSPVYAWVGGDCDDDCPDDCPVPEHETIHLWAREGEEGISDPIYERETTEESDPYSGFICGIAMPLPVFDQLVVMRYAQLVEEPDNFRRAVDAVRGLGNFGAFRLRELLGEDPMAELRRHLDEASKDREEAS